MAEGSGAGPVAITGAGGQVGVALQRRLSGAVDVRPLSRSDDLRAAFADAAVVVHLAGTLRPKRPNTYRAANLDTVVATLAALRGSSVTRLVFLSYLDADRASANPYLRFKGEAEDVIRSSDTPAVVFRAAHVYGPPDAPGPTAAAMLSERGRVSVLGPGNQRYAWLAKQDVVEALAAAAVDPTTPTGTYQLAGPEPLTVDEFVRHVNGPQIRIRHLPAGTARLLGRVLPSLPAPLVDVMLRDCLPTADPWPTARRFGCTLHRLADVWPRR